MMDNKDRESHLFTDDTDKQLDNDSESQSPTLKILNEINNLYRSRLEYVKEEVGPKAYEVIFILFLFVNTYDENIISNYVILDAKYYLRGMDTRLTNPK